MSVFGDRTEIIVQPWLHQDSTMEPAHIVYLRNLFVYAAGTLPDDRRYWKPPLMQRFVCSFVCQRFLYATLLVRLLRLVNLSLNVGQYSEPMSHADHVEPYLTGRP